MFTSVALARRALPLFAALALVACDVLDDDTPDAGSGTPDGGTGTPDGGGGAIGGLTDDTWTWVPFPESRCRDGSSTGIGVNTHAGATKLMIYLQGGGACFNAVTCAVNPANFDEAAFDAEVAQSLSAGIFNRTDAANPARDYNFVFVPYCTGDVHAGNNPEGSILTLGTQQYVGFANVGRYLERLVPTFPGTTEVLLTGSSAGGFGSVANYVQVADAFAGVNVNLVDDAGPPMRQPFLAKCQQETWIDLWRLDETFLPSCGAACATEGEMFLGSLRHATSTYPNGRFGLVSSVGDEINRSFFGFGEADCALFLPLTEETFEDGLLNIRDDLATAANYGDFLFAGTDHTTLVSDFDTRTAGGVAFTDWLGDVLSGTATHVGP